MGKSWAGCLLAAGIALIGSPAVAQVVANPNQIVGTVRFTNADPAVLALLDDPDGLGFALGTVSAFGPGGQATSDVEVGTRRLASYELTVESSAEGIAYWVDVDMQHGGAGTYAFASRQSAPVVEEPAPDVVVDFAECAGILHVFFENADGTPAVVRNANVTARVENPPGSGVTLQQSAGTSPRGRDVSELRFPVRGGETFFVTVRYETGSDPYFDRFSYREEQATVVGCDEVVALRVVLPPLDGSELLSSIVGTFDVLGEAEHWHGGRTDLQAVGGPLGNYRYGTIPRQPSEGAFELVNVVPSTLTDPPTGYVFAAEARFRTGRRFTRFTAPRLDDANGRLFVEESLPFDLGDTFVIDPGLVSGALRLVGPPPGAAHPSLADVRRTSDDDADGDGIPDNPAAKLSQVEALGVPEAVPGARATTEFGLVQAQFTGEHDAASGELAGDYELVLGGLHAEASLWLPDRVRVHLEDVATPDEPESYVDSHLIVIHRDQEPVLVRPGEVTSIDREYCFSEVQLGFRAHTGRFYRPRVEDTSRGSFRGRDFRGLPTDYDVLLDAEGTPRCCAAEPTGLVVLCLPQGQYDLNPWVTFRDPGGGTSDTRLPFVSLDVGCGQRIRALNDLLLHVDALPRCVGAPELTVTGSVDGDLSIARIYHVLGGGAEIDACVGCGVDPGFEIPVTLEDGDNVLEVVAVDDAGGVASVTFHVSVAREPSARDRDPAAEPLRVVRAPDAGLRLTWEDNGVTPHHAYRGTLAALWDDRTYDHGPTGGCFLTLPTVDLELGVGDAYFLVTSACAGGDGSLGRDSRGVERPVGAPSCR